MRPRDIGPDAQRAGNNRPGLNEHARISISRLACTYRLLMLAECRMDDTTVEENLGCVRNAIKHLQCLVELVAVVAREGCHPGFDFLPRH
jgi:hypothetical protein